MLHDFVPLLAAAALVVKIVALVKYVSAQAWEDLVTQLVTWGAGVLVVSLLAASGLEDGVPVGDTTLGALNGAGVAFVGVTLGPVGSVLLYDFRKAVDNSDTAAEPKLGRRTRP